MGDDRDHDEQPERPGFGDPPGHIPVPPEKSWDAEPPNPYEEIERKSPFDGRPPSEVVLPDEVPLERYREPASDEPIPPGQPLPRQGGDDPDDPGMS